VARHPANSNHQEKNGCEGCSTGPSSDEPASSECRLEPLAWRYKVIYQPSVSYGRSNNEQCGRIGFLRLFEIRPLADPWTYQPQGFKIRDNSDGTMSPYLP
jgi:hypothetical protein